MEPGESNFEQNKLTLDDLSLSQEVLNSLRETVRNFLREDNLDEEGLQEELKEKLKSIHDRELKQQVVRALNSEINKRGRLAVYVGVTSEFGLHRGVGSGFQSIVNNKSENENQAYLFREFSSNRNYYRRSFRPDIDIGFLLKEEGINAAVTMVPVIEETPIYKKEVQKTGIWPFQKEKEVMKPTGETDKKPVIMDQVGGDAKDKEATCEILYGVYSTPENPYIEADGYRQGNIFESRILLPQTIAEKAFDLIKKDPSFVKKILEILDPELMREQEIIRPQTEYLKRGCMPKISEIMIVEKVIEILKDSDSVKEMEKVSFVNTRKKCKEF